MKKWALLVVLAFLTGSLVGSCKKESKTPAVTETQGMSLMLNGAALSYNACRVQDFTINGSVQTQITGQNTADISTGTYDFTIAIYGDMNSFKAGEVFHVETSAYEANAMVLFYSPDSSDVFESQPANPQGTVTITGVGSGFIQGTFSGELFTSTDFAGANVKYAVTGGTFTAKMQ